MAEIGDGNMAVQEVAPRQDLAQETVSRLNDTVQLHLIAPEPLLGALSGRIPAEIRNHDRSTFDVNAVVELAASGHGLIWIGPADGLPPEMHVGRFRPSEAKLAVCASEGAPLALNEGWPQFQDAHVDSAYLRPPVEMPNHNHNEEVRGEFVPLLEARDRMGQVVGWPGVLMSYTAPSLVMHRFAGCECFCFFFDDPLAALDAQGWLVLLSAIAARFRSGLQLLRLQSDYASYRPGERVRLTARVMNHRDHARAIELRWWVRGSEENEYRLLFRQRRCSEAHDETEARFDFRPAAREGLWRVRLEICQDLELAAELARVGQPQIIDTREIGFVLAAPELKTDLIVEVEGQELRIAGEAGFHAGTHYYPSSSWWEWAWRDFHPLAVDRDFAAIRRSGYRLMRMWADPVLDEEAMRAIDAALVLAARHGLVVILCVFNQWVGEIGFERENGEKVQFEFRNRADYNVYGISLRNMRLQRELIGVLARRWRQAGNLLYNLANETYLKDPDASQMDDEVRAWDGIASKLGCARDSQLFRRWAAEITKEIRAAEAPQAILSGYLFSTLNGGDSYLANRDSDIAPWHCYGPPEMCGTTLQYFDATCSNRPYVLQEFGILGWNKPAHYDACAHYALAAGAAAAVAYEWGVSWLAPEMCNQPLPMRTVLDSPWDERWFGPAREIAKSWPARGVGICLTPSGFGYGSIYHGTPFPAQAAVALGRMGKLRQDMTRGAEDAAVMVLIPAAAMDHMQSCLDFFHALWRAHVIFGVWQEDSIAQLPANTRLLLCPLGVPQSAGGFIDDLKARGMEVLTGTDDAWRRSPNLITAHLMGSGNIDLMTRRTRGGRLFSLIGEQAADCVSVETDTSRVQFGLSDFALFHQRANGIGLIEGSGQIQIDKAWFCEIIGARLLVESIDERALTMAPMLHLLPSGPCRVRFAREIVGAVAYRAERDQAQPITGCMGACQLEIDDQLAAYELELTFSA